MRYSKEAPTWRITDDGTDGIGHGACLHDGLDIAVAGEMTEGSRGGR